MIKLEGHMSPIYDALVSKMKKAYNENPIDKNITIKLTKDEVIAIIGDVEFTPDLFSDLIYMRYEEKYSSTAIFSSVSWYKGVLSAEFSKFAIPYLNKEK